MKFTAIFLAALTAAVALSSPTPDTPTDTLAKRAGASYSRATLQNVVRSDQDISQSLSVAAKRLQQNANALASGKGRSIEAARRAHLNAVEAVQRAIHATNAAASGIKRML
ncbi:hypothetical protein FBU59_004465 [Linderina macrospora]|uniref:Uncharacterized protein n=1 Tax=Linderina macrospora TaxID=4868 RepID=A0ACC1J5Q1_9FUNG|nr:hypothetical protein FBU59_004465 [Linderina macrospora]